MNEINTRPTLANDADTTLLELTSEIVGSYVGHNSLSQTDLPRLIGDVYRALAGLTSPVPQPVLPTEPLKPAVPVRKSITPDYMICLDDGKRFKSLKRHIASLGMTPQQYRDKWNLAPDYPMVAPNYSATRSALAKTNGLGRKPVEEVKVPARRGRKPAAATA